MGRAMQDLDVWLEPFLAALGHKKRRLWAPLYLRGLLGPSERKSLQPMAASLGLPGHDQLQHFIASPAWDDAPLWRVLAEQADRLVGGPDAALVIDDTALPKKGALSVGVARQYCGQLGKKANCQALVSLTLARGEVPAPCGPAPVPARRVDRQARALHPGRRAGGGGRGPEQGRDRARRVGPAAGGRGALRDRAGRRGLRRERGVPPRPGRAGA